MLRWMLLPAFMLILVAAAGLLAAPSLAPSAGADEPPTVHGVASELMCQCGCALTVSACQESMTCSIADSIVAEITSQIEEGKTKREILDGFATIYGEEVLALPRKSGFSLTAWVAPAVAVVVGAVLVSALVWGWAKRRPAPATVATAPEDLDAYEQRVDEELRLLE